MTEYCSICGKKLGLINRAYYEKEKICGDCYEKIEYMRKFPGDSDTMDYAEFFESCMNSGITKENLHGELNQLIEERANKIEIKPEIKPVYDCLVTSGPAFEGYYVENYYDVISTEIVLGTGPLSEISAQLSDFFGITDTGFEEKLSLAKSSALNKLKKNALLMGGNAVIAVDFDLMTIGSNMIVASATGTVVRVKKIQETD